jgi:hypothetical protein
MLRLTSEKPDAIDPVSAEVANRILPDMEREAIALAKSYAGAPPPQLTSQTIEYPSLLYVLAEDYPEARAQTASEITARNKEFETRYGESKPITGPSYVEGPPNCSSSIGFELAQYGFDLGVNYDGSRSGAYDPELFHTKHHLSPDGAMFPSLDPRRVKTIALVLYRISESKVYNRIWSTSEDPVDPHTHIGEAHSDFATRSTFSTRVFIVDKVSHNVTAFRSFRPAQKLPSGSGGSPSEGINRSLEAAQCAWFSSLSPSRR